MTQPPHRHLLGALFVGSVAAGASPAMAQYEATAYGTGSNPIGHTTTPGDVSYAYTGTGPAGTSSSGTVSFTAAPVASIGVSTSAASAVGQSSGGGSGFMTYSFEVQSQPSSLVPIDFSGLYASYVYSSAPSGNNASATTRFVVQQTNTNVARYASFSSFFYGDCGNPGCLQYSNTTLENTTFTTSRPDLLHVGGSFQGSVDMLTNADGKITGQVQLTATAGQNVFFTSSSASAFIDPHLEIDATYLAAHPGATLTITPGVGNQIGAAVAVVPEPGTWALMAAGLGLAGVASRRRAALPR